MNMTLPTNSAERKEVPVFSGVLKYAPAAIAGVARVSKAGNDKHNPGEPLHHARGKSTDHSDCIVRHAMDVADIEAAIERRGVPYSDGCDEGNAACKAAILNEVSQLTWRALMWSQELHEKYGGAPLAPGARLPEPLTAKNSSFVLKGAVPVGYVEGGGHHQGGANYAAERAACEINTNGGTREHIRDDAGHNKYCWCTGL